MAGKFAKEIVQFNTKTLANTRDVLHRLGFDILGRLIRRSPVDTGRFRSNWQVGINESPEGMFAVFDKDGIIVGDKGRAAIKEAVLGDTLYIVNNLPYAVPLERGHSQQAPAGMVGITVAEFAGIVTDIVEVVKSK